MTAEVRTRALFDLADALVANVFSLATSTINLVPKGVKPMSVRREHTNARRLAMYLAATCFDVTQDAVAEHYHVTRTLVSKIVTNFDARRAVTRFDDWLDRLQSAMTDIVASVGEYDEANAGDTDGEE